MKLTSKQKELLKDLALTAENSVTCAVEFDRPDWKSFQSLQAKGLVKVLDDKPVGWKGLFDVQLTEEGLKVVKGL